jgi:hypothetical protein
MPPSIIMLPTRVGGFKLSFRFRRRVMIGVGLIGELC